jgi:hypothetical protein
MPVQIILDKYHLSLYSVRTVNTEVQMNAKPNTETKTCPAELAYRDMADIGPARICGCPVKPGRLFCGRHDPELKPKRDERGRILKRPHD